MKLIKFKNTLTLNTNFNILINFTSNNESYSSMKVQTRTFAEGTIKIFFYGNNGVCYNLNDWADENYKTIEIDPNQPNYNEFITAMSNNIESIVDSGTNKLKFGTEIPTKLYMGDSEVTKVYMGETLVYEKSSSSGYRLSF